MDTEPPSKRRRTSQDGSDYSPRPASRSRSRSRDRSQSPPANENDGHPLRRPSFPPDTPSEDYNTPRSRRHSQSRSRSRSDSPIPPTQGALSFKPLFTLPHAHVRGITCVKFSPNKSLLATASADASINIYAVPDKLTPDTPFKLLRTLRSHKAGVNTISWSPIGPPYILASASDDKSILLWDPLSSDFPIPPSPITGHSNYVYSIAFSPKGNMLVSGSYDEAVFLWDVRSARVMRQLPAHSDPVSGVDFIRDGTMVCSCASDGLIRIWDSATGQCLKTLVDEDRKGVTAVRFTPNGRFVVAWTLDNCIRLWRYLGEAACVKTYKGHINNKYSLGGVIGDYNAFDERTGLDKVEAFLASGSEDGDVVVWDINSKDVLWRGVGHSDVVLSVDFARAKDGRGLLVSVGKDRALRVWIEQGEGIKSGVAEVSEITAGDINVDVDVDVDVDVAGHMVRMEIKREDTEMNDA